MKNTSWCCEPARAIDEWLTPSAAMAFTITVAATNMQNEFVIVVIQGHDVTKNC